MTSRWRKRLGKVADVMFTIPVGSALWGSEMHEPVVVAFICPLLRSMPWEVSGTNLVNELRKEVSGEWTPCLTRERDGIKRFWNGAQMLGIGRPSAQLG